MSDIEQDEIERIKNLIVESVARAQTDLGQFMRPDTRLSACT